MGRTPMNMFQDAEFVQELKRPWMNFFHVLIVYGFAWLAGAAGLTLLHVMFTERSAVPPSNTHKAEGNHDVPNVTPPVLPGGLPSDLVSTLPSGSELTLTDVIKWNENVATYASKDVAAYRNSITVKTSDLPSLGEKQSNDTNFLSSIRSLPIMSKEGKIVGVLDSNQLKEIKDYKTTYQPTFSIDKGDTGDQRDTKYTSSIGWRTTFFPKDDLLKMKVVEYTWSKADSKVPSGLGIAKQYFLLDPTR
jgi:hypothetical protein